MLGLELSPPLLSRNVTVEPCSNRSFRAGAQPRNLELLNSTLVTKLGFVSLQTAIGLLQSAGGQMA